MSSLDCSRHSQCRARCSDPAGPSLSGETVKKVVDDALEVARRAGWRQQQLLVEVPQSWSTTPVEGRVQPSAPLAFDGGDGERAPRRRFVPGNAASGRSTAPGRSTGRRPGPPGVADDTQEGVQLRAKVGLDVAVSEGHWGSTVWKYVEREGSFGGRRFVDRHRAGAGPLCDLDGEGAHFLGEQQVGRGSRISGGTSVAGSPRRAGLIVGHGNLLREYMDKLYT